MNIKRYASLFHDGAIVEIIHTGNKILVFMESAEMDEGVAKDSVFLSKGDKLAGILHIEGIKSIKENGQPYFNSLKKKYDHAEILHFEITKTRVEFQIKWKSHPPKTKLKEFSKIEIEAERFWWENCSIYQIC